MFPAATPGFADRFFWHRKLSTDSYRHQLARGISSITLLVISWVIGGRMILKPEKFLGFGKSS